MYSVILIMWKLTKLSHIENVHTIFEDNLRPAWTDATEEWNLFLNISGFVTCQTKFALGIAKIKLLPGKAE